MDKTTKEQIDRTNTLLMQITLLEAAVMNAGRALADLKREGDISRTLLRQEVARLREG